MPDHTGAAGMRPAPGARDMDPLISPERQRDASGACRGQLGDRRRVVKCGQSPKARQECRVRASGNAYPTARRPQVGGSEAAAGHTACQGFRHGERGVQESCGKFLCSHPPIGTRRERERSGRFTYVDGPGCRGPVPAVACSVVAGPGPKHPQLLSTQRVGWGGAWTEWGGAEQGCRAVRPWPRPSPGPSQGAGPGARPGGPP